MLAAGILERIGAAMKIGALSWNGNNIGDDIQTIAVMQHIPPVDVFLNREELNSYDGPELLLVMNGWFLRDVRNWPPSKAIRPIFFGFHVRRGARETVARHVDYLRRFQPIGCRDRGTFEFVRSLGVEAYISYCSTMTFDAPEDRSPDSLYLVEASLDDVPKRLRRSHGLIVREVSHRFIDVPTATRLGYAKELVRTYGRTAGMVITSRIHCALPCVAMGIPTLFIGQRNYRTELVEEAGLPLNERRPLPMKLFSPTISEWPKAHDIGALKEKIRGDLRQRVAAALAG